MRQSGYERLWMLFFLHFTAKRIYVWIANFTILIKSLRIMKKGARNIASNNINIGTKWIKQISFDIRFSFSSFFYTIMKMMMMMMVLLCVRGLFSFLAYASVCGIRCVKGRMTADVFVWRSSARFFYYLKVLDNIAVVLFSMLL